MGLILFCFIEFEQKFCICTYRVVASKTQIREQMSGPDLHVFTLKFLALEKTGYSPIKNTFPVFKKIVYLYSMQLFSADPKIFSKIK